MSLLVSTDFPSSFVLTLVGVEGSWTNGLLLLLLLVPQVGDVVQIKLTSRDPSPPPFEYVAGGGGIFKDMAVHDLDMVRLGEEEQEWWAVQGQ